MIKELGTLEPCLTLGIELPDVGTGTGAQLKSIEDQLDAVLAAYIGAYWWYWGTEGSEVFGDIDNGYIIVPKTPPRAIL